VRHLQFQDHDRDDDGEDAVAEGLESVRFHRAIFYQSRMS
jgi:hypothetical protein